MKFLKFALVVFALMLLKIDPSPAQENVAKAYEKLKKQVEGVAKDTESFGSNLNKAMQSLSKVSTSEPKNQAKTIKSFQKDVDGLNKALKKATDGIKGLREKREQYISEWERSIEQISNPDLKKTSEERRQKVIEAHTQLTERATAVREEIDGFMQELSDLVTFLGGDPTVEAVSASKATIDKVLADGKSLSDGVQEVSSRLNAFAKGTS